MIKDKFRISELPSASIPVERVYPDDNLQKATSKMMMHDFSQLPVMTNERDVKGIISWKTIGIRKQLGNKNQLVKDCMDSNFSVISYRENLLKSVKKVLEEEFVLVMDETKKICGCCTPTDIGERFLIQARPFIEIEQIEGAIRRWIADKVDLGFFVNLHKGSVPTRQFLSVSDLSFGDYIRWFEDKVNWRDLDIELDRKIFVEELKKINLIRNSLMHFRNDEISESQMVTLRKINRFLRIHQSNHQS